MGCHVHHADISNALLNEYIDGERYGLRGSKCYKPQRSLHGLKQSEHLWHKKLNNALKRVGLTQLELKLLFSTSWTTKRF